MRVRIAILCLMALPLLSACTEDLVFRGAVAGISAAANDVFARPDVNLREKNYAAADYLLQQMRPNTNRRTTIIFAQRLEEADNPGISSPLGLAIPREIGLRLSELGYKTYVHHVQAFGAEGLNPPPPAGVKPTHILKGTYARGTQNVDVKLRLIDTRDGTITARFDYTLPLSREIREAVKTQTQIFQVKP